MSRRQEDLRMKSTFMKSRDRRDDMGHDPYLTSHSGAREEQHLRSRRSFSPHHTPEGSLRTIARERRSRDHRDDLGDDPYLVSRSGAREEQHMRSRRNFSPQHTPEGTLRTIARERRSSSFDRRREYEQHFGRAHGDHELSNSPPIERVQKRPHLGERAFNTSPTSVEINKKCDYPEYQDYTNINTRSKHPYSYDERFDVGREEDYIERRSGASRYRPLAQNYVPVEDAMDREVQLRPNYGFASRYEEASRCHTTVDVHRLKDENTRYQGAVPHEKLSKVVYYKGGEKYAYYSRGSPYLESPISPHKDFDSEDLLKGVPGSSSSIAARGEYSSKVHDVHTSPSDRNPKSYIRGIEPRASDDYYKRTVSDTRRGYEPRHTDAKCDTCYAYASARAEHKYPEIGLRIIDDPSYHHHGSLDEKMTKVHGEHDCRRVVGPGIMTASVESISKADDSHFSRRIIKDGGVREFQKEMAQDHEDMRRSDALKQAGDYLDYRYTHVELTKKASNHHHKSEFGGLPEHEVEDPHFGYGYGRCPPASSDRTRMKMSPELRNEVELKRLVGGSERSKAEEPIVYERTLKRKYNMDEDISRANSRSVIPSKWDTHTETHDFDDHQVDWTTGRKSSSGHSNRPSVYEKNHYNIEAEQMFEEIYHHKDTANVGWTSYQDQSKSNQEDSEKLFKVQNRHLKGYAKSESSKHYSHVHHSRQRSNYYKQHHLRQRNEDVNHMPVHARDIDLPEDSEGFKQRMQAAFLDFSKRFNDNPTARKLYLDQGKASSLFCVVCRRSASKEFLDTRALATHAFMSHKGGLRPQHLGLHKAICVLMGWNIVPDRDSGTWTAEALPQAEALAQKEDLILWPPAVIVHNISLSSNDHNEWKLINIEALGEFLRGKGFSLGKMKICLGNPGDHSVIVVKFLSTFSGLQEAERLHKYFLDRKHGRTDFEQANSSILGKTDDFRQGSNQVDQLEDVLLYGYMGISEDVDKIDFDTKRKCLVKSKKEIHDLADAPVKPE